MLAAAALGVGMLAGCDPAIPGPSSSVPPAASSPASAAPSISATPPPVTTAAPVAAPTVTTTTEPPAAPPRTTANPPVAPPLTAAPDPGAACGGDYYINSDGNCVHRPEPAPTPPAGATARCNDGTYSFSQHRSGTCSHHGGVAEWLA